MVSDVPSECCVCGVPIGVKGGVGGTLQSTSGLWLCFARRCWRQHEAVFCPDNERLMAIVSRRREAEGHARMAAHLYADALEHAMKADAERDAATARADAASARLARAEALLREAGVCELAAHNPNVASYCREWEVRAEKAEWERDEERTRYLARGERDAAELVAVMKQRDDAATALLAAAIPLEALAATECDEAATALDKDVKADVLRAVEKIRAYLKAAIGTDAPTPDDRRGEDAPSSDEWRGVDADAIEAATGRARPTTEAGQAAQTPP